jgi:hypothetical protein
MRIKSYFAGSIQTAMRQARDEFGDDVMLVTSRITDPEVRHLGEYEVVLAVDGDEQSTKQILRDQFLPARVPERPNREAAVGAIRSSLIDIGLEPQQMEALLALIENCAPSNPAVHSQVHASVSPAEASPPVEVCSEASPPPTTSLDCVGSGMEVEVFGTASPKEQMPSSAQSTGSQSPMQLQIEEQRVHDPVPYTRATPKDFSKSGYMLLLIAFALYGITRPSGS